jgi:hypothetical protein
MIVNSNVSEGENLKMAASASPLGVARGTEIDDNPSAKRLSITLTDSAYAEVSALARSTRQKSTDLMRLGLAIIKIYLAEHKEGNRLMVVSRDGQAIKEIVLPI